MGLIGNIMRRWKVGPDDSVARPGSWLAELIGTGGKSRAGVRVTEDNVTTLSAAWACARAISEDTAKIPLKIYRREGENDRTSLRDHPAYRLLNGVANADLVSAFIVREYLAWSMVTWGNGFAEIEKTRSGRPLAIWPLLASRMKLRRRDDGQLEYVYQNDDGSFTILEPADVLHVRGPTKDGLVGYSVVSQARESLGAAMATDLFAASFWHNGARPSGAFVRSKDAPGQLSAEAKKNLRDSIQAIYAGVANAGRPILLEDGMTWQPFSVPPDDAQFLDTRKFGVVEVCRWFRVPPHKVFDLDRSTNNNIEHQSIEYVQDGLGAWMRRIETEAGIKLLSPAEQDTHYIEHLVDGLLRGDQKARYDAYALARQWGFASVNEIRARENMNAIEGGDQYLVPANMTTAAKLEEAPAPGGDPAPEPAPDPASRAAAAAAGFGPVLADALRRVGRIEAERCQRSWAKGAAACQAWAEEYFRDRSVEVRAALMAGVEGCAVALRHASMSIDVAAVAEELAQAYVAGSRRALATAIAGGSVAEVVADWEKGNRAERDAAAALKLIVERAVAPRKDAA